VTDIPTSFHPDLQVTQPNAYIDVLVPAYTSRARNNKRIGNSLVLTEAHGLADALLRPPIQLELEMHRLNGEVLRADLSFADEVSALVLKASTTQIRSKDTDIVDIWRCLEICNAAQIGPDSFLAGAPAEAADVVRALFSSREGAGIAAIASSQNLSVQAADIRYTRISALVERTFGLN
jgi:hypothetical protein